MSTTYPGREDHHDLGGGHSFVWLCDRTSAIIGLIEFHPAAADAIPGSRYCGGYIAWTAGDAEPGKTPPWKLSGHTLERGGEDDLAALTIAPSLACRHCPSHGFIREGRWIEA